MNRKKGMRLWLPIVLCLTLVAVLCACGRMAPTADMPPTEEETRPMDTTAELPAITEETESITFPETTPITLPDSSFGSTDPSEQETLDPKPGGDTTREPISTAPGIVDTTQGSRPEETLDTSLAQGDGEKDPESTPSLAFSLSADGKFYIVTGIGTIVDEDVEIPMLYEGLPVREIAKNAFRGTQVESVIISESVERIGNHAFYGCSALERVTFAEGSVLSEIGDAAFASTGIERLILPESLELIGIGAFLRTESLTHVTISSTSGWWCTSDKDAAYGAVIGKDVLGNGEALAQYLRMESYSRMYWKRPKGQLTYSLSGTDDDPHYSIVSVGGFVGTELTIPSEYAGLPVRIIESGAFRGCTGITSVTIPASITYIQNGAFWGCTSLTTMTLPMVEGRWTLPDLFGEYDDSSNEVPASLKHVRVWETVKLCNRAFLACASLESVTLDATVREIGENAFEKCTSLTSFTFGKEIEWIGKCAFLNCTALAQVSFVPVSENDLVIDECAFTGCSSLERFEPPVNLERIGNGALQYCSSLTEMKLPFVGASRGVTGGTESSLCYLFGGWNFFECASYVPASLKSIAVTSDGVGEYAFYNCANLERVTLTGYSYETADGTVSSDFTYIGGLAFYGCTGIEHIEIPNTVTAIGNAAFASCTSLTDIVLPAGLCEIRENTFMDCTNLCSVTLPERLTDIYESAFLNCYHLAVVYNLSSQISVTVGSSDYGYVGYYASDVYTDISVPSGIWTDENGFSFYENENGCYLLGYRGEASAISLPEDCHGKSYEIRKYAFCGNETLENVTIPDGVTGIGECAFDNSSYLLQYENGVYYADKWALCFNESNDNIYLRADTVGIADMAFYNCINTYSARIPDSVQYIGDSAFYKCHSINSLTFGENSRLRTIGKGAFEGCEALSEITIPGTVILIEAGAFENCGNLSAVTFEEKSGWRYDDALISSDTLADASTAASCLTYYANCVWKRESRGLEFASNGDGTCTVTGMGECVDRALVIPTTSPDGDTVTRIGDGAFASCYTVTSLIIPDTVISIGSSAFAECDGLTSLIIPDSVVSIGNYAFYDCDALTSVTIPDSVVSIGNCAFYDCGALTFVIIGNSVVSIGEEAFYECESLTRVVIGKSVTHIEEGAFYKYSGVITVYYLGSAGEWVNIEIDEYNTTLTNGLRYYYSENQPTDAIHRYWHYVDGVPTAW